MSDMILTLFMADTGITDEAVAANVLYKFGLAPHYEDFAAKLEPLVDKIGDEAFASGVEFLQEVFQGIRFNVRRDQLDTEFVAGLNYAMQTVTDVLQAATDGARMTDEDVSRAEAVQDASILPLDMNTIHQIISAMFDNRKGQ